MYWVGLLFSFFFSWFSYVGAGFALIVAAGFFVFRVFLRMRMKSWRIALLFLAPLVGLSIGQFAFALTPVI